MGKVGFIRYTKILPKTQAKLFVVGMAIRELALARFVGSMGDLENSWLVWSIGNWALAQV